LGVTERRRRVYEYYKRGITSTNIVKNVSSEFGCSERTVWRDLGSRDNWMARVEPPSESTVDAFLRLSLDLLVIREHILKDFDENNDYVKVKLCKILVDTLFSEFDYARKLGVFEAYIGVKMMGNLVNEYRNANGGDELEFGSD